MTSLSCPAAQCRQGHPPLRRTLDPMCLRSLGAGHPLSVTNSKGLWPSWKLSRLPSQIPRVIIWKWQWGKNRPKNQWLRNRSWWFPMERHPWNELLPSSGWPRLKGYRLKRHQLKMRTKTVPEQPAWMGRMMNVSLTMSLVIAYWWCFYPSALTVNKVFTMLAFFLSNTIIIYKCFFGTHNLVTLGVIAFISWYGPGLRVCGWCRATFVSFARSICPKQEGCTWSSWSWKFPWWGFGRWYPWKAKKPPRVTVDPLRRKQPQRIQRKVHVRGALGTTMKPGWNFWLIWRNPGSPSLKLRRNGTIATRNVNSCQHCRFQNWKEGNLFPNHARPTHGPSFSLNFQIYFGVGSQLEHGPQQLAGECD